MEGSSHSHRHSPRLRIDLLEFDLMRSYGFSVSVEDEEAGTGGSLIDRTYKDFLGSHVWRGGRSG